MKNHARKYLIPLLLIALISGVNALADTFSLRLHQGKNIFGLPVENIASMILFSPDSVQVVTTDSSLVTFGRMDSLTYSSALSDTLYLLYNEEDVIVLNPHAEAINVSKDTDNADVILSVDTFIDDPVIVVSGYTNNGRLRIDSKVDYTLVLNSVSLKSKHAPAFNSTTKQKVRIILADNSVNYFEDAESYSFSDSAETSNGCFYSLGAITFEGKGTLQVTGKSKHALASKKSMTFKAGTYIVSDAHSDAVHSGKNITIERGTFQMNGMLGDGFDADGDFCMQDGSIEMTVEGIAAKGIKSKGLMQILDGNLSIEASGALENKDGDLSYCSILKCDSCIEIRGGKMTLNNKSLGGKCITSSQCIHILGGEITMQTSGDGASYINIKGEEDYYTSKCISAKDSLIIWGGHIECLSTGIGGKGIVADRYMQIGAAGDSTLIQDPFINVETTNTCVINDIDEDLRFGCPKGIKSDSILVINNGDIQVTTHGMGGEGIESNAEMHVYGGNVECNTYDDGINVGQKLTIYGGQVYCNSIDNDGIDSNGSIYIKGGIVASINHFEPNESFDAENAEIHISGGVVIGIGSMSVKMAEQDCLYYNTLFNNNPDKPIRRGLRITNGKYVYVMDGEQVMLAIKNLNENRRGFVTVSLPDFIEKHKYSICQDDAPPNSGKVMFHNNLYLDGQKQNIENIVDFIPLFNFND